MTRCPRCRAILPQKTAACPFCDGEPEADLLEIAEAAGTPDPERFVAASMASARAAARRGTIPAPGPRAGEVSPPASGARDPWPAAPAPEAAVAEPEIAEVRVSRHDEPIGFQRSPLVQAVIIALLLLFLAVAIAWFWD